MSLVTSILFLLFLGPLYSLSRLVVLYIILLVLLHHPSGTRPKLNLKGWAGDLSPLSSLSLSLSLSHLRSNALQCSNDEHI